MTLKCTDKFPKFRRNYHFLVDLDTYIYKSNDFPEEDKYLKTILTNFWEGIGFMDEDDPSGGKLPKRKKRHIKTKL